MFPLPALAQEPCDDTELEVVPLQKRMRKYSGTSTLSFNRQGMKFGNRKHQVTHLQTKVTAGTQNVIDWKQLESQRARGHKLIMRGLSDTGMKGESYNPGRHQEYFQSRQQALGFTRDSSRAGAGVVSRWRSQPRWKQSTTPGQEEMLRRLFSVKQLRANKQLGRRRRV